MGEVYLARDLALGRAAALKVLPDRLDDALRPRLLREAEASARLQHLGIATFYEAGESDGIAFIAMEYVSGQTLRDRLLDGPLPLRAVLRRGRCLRGPFGKTGRPRKDGRRADRGDPDPRSAAP